MKKMMTVIGGIVLSATFALANVTPGEKEVLKVDAEESMVYWTGKKVSGEHTGTLKIKAGTVAVEDGMPTTAKIDMDMNSIDCTDLEGEWKNKLIGHLKSEDFFSVEKFPAATFEVKSFTKAGAKYTVVGDLSIKGITHEISFPADVTLDSGVLTASGTAKIDRTQWNIRYGSGKFFEGLGDKMIYDDFEIKFELTAH